MSNPERASIIIPMYNCAKYIQQCLDSVARQSWYNIEAILVDDCSTDSTVELCRSFVEKDNRFTLLCNAENGGPGKARNIGIDAAKGNFLMFLDADDWLNYDAVATLIKAQKDSKADIVISAFNKIQSAPQNTSVRIFHFADDKSLNRQEICSYALSYMREPGKYVMFSYSWGRLFLSSVFKEKKLGFLPNLRICEDVHFNFEYMRHANKVFYVNVATYNYRFGNPESAAMQLILKGGEPLLFYNDIWTAYLNIFKFIKEFDEECKLQDVLKITRLGHISHAIVLLVRACGYSKRKPLFKLIYNMVNNQTVQENLKCYFPLKGQSRLLPFLLRRKLVLPTILLGKYKYIKRYGKKSRIKI